jgi:hypothetical protein
MRKEAFLNSMDSRLEAVTARIEDLYAEAIARGDGDKAFEYAEHVEVLRLRREEAHRKLEELSEADEGDWGRLRAGVESAFGRLESELDEALVSMRKIA